MIKRFFLAACFCVAFASFANAQQAQEKTSAVNDADYNAGYRWAEDADVQDETDCTSGSKSFIAGCAAWANDEDAANKNTEDSGDDRED